MMVIWWQKLAPPPGYSNEDFKNIVHLRTAFLSGRVFEHRTPSQLLAADKGIASADVILVRQGENTLAARSLSATTDADGYYYFPVTVADDTRHYGIAVSAKSFASGNRLAEQTWSGPGGQCVVSRDNPSTQSLTRQNAGYCFGGKNGAVADKLDSVSPDIDQAQHLIKLTLKGPDLPAQPQSNLDFGFSYDVVTNTNDSGQGSLRQFILNANDGSGSGKMLFVPVVPENNGRGWKVQLQSALPKMTWAGMRLDGKAWNHQQPGQPALTEESARSGVKVGSLQSSLKNFFKPDLELVPNSGVDGSVLSMSNQNQSISHFSLMPVMKSGSLRAIKVEKQCQGCQIQDNFMGFPASGEFSSLNHSLYMAVESASGSQVTIHHNWIKHSRSSGIHLQGSGSITNNLMEGNASDDGSSDAVVFQGVTSESRGREITVENNFIKGAKEMIIDGWKFIHPGKLHITNNTLSEGGKAGIRLMAYDDTGKNIIVAKNLIQKSLGPGVIIAPQSKNAPSKGNKLSENRFEDNQGLPIDLLKGDPGGYGDGATANTGGYRTSFRFGWSLWQLGD